MAGREWYHTIELAPGLLTPGWFDLRPIAPEVLPDSLTGHRALDVAAFDGFWSLELQARGASEVVAIDILDPREWDWPVGAGEQVVEAIAQRKGSGEGYDIVMKALGRDIERRAMSVYDLDPESIGKFDFVYVGSLLLHLRDPVRALERVRSVCTGQVVLVDSYDPLLTLLHPRRAIASLDGEERPWWWRPNARGLTRMLRSAGLDVVGRPRRVRLPRGAGQPMVPISPSVIASRQGRVALHTSRLGDPHLAITATPRR